MQNRSSGKEIQYFLYYLFFFFWGGGGKDGVGGGIITHDLSLSSMYHFDITVSNFILV